MRVLPLGILGGPAARVGLRQLPGDGGGAGGRVVHGLRGGAERADVHAVRGRQPAGRAAHDRAVPGVRRGQVRGHLPGPLVAPDAPKGLSPRRVEDRVLQDHRRQPQPQLHVRLAAILELLKLT